jgi:pyruvate formate lyase activating enzyme
VAFTYNDPVIFLEYAVDTAVACRELGVKTVAVTAGYIELEPLAELARHLDAANVDLKAFTTEFYRRLCTADLAPVLEAIEYLVRETEVWVEITTLLIPGENDSDAELNAACAWVAEHLGPDLPWHFTAFHPDYRMQNHNRTEASTLTRAREIAQGYGLRYVYTGNVHDNAGQSTYCHGCGARLIGRDWYELTDWNLTAEGRCAQCGETCTGVFEAKPGTWGQRRLPVRIEVGAGL